MGKHQMNMRLTQEERGFLQKKGNGNLSEGVRECMSECGFTPNTLQLYCSDCGDGQGFVFYRMINGKPVDFAFYDNDTEEPFALNFENDDVSGFNLGALEYMITAYFEGYYSKDTEITVTSNDYGFSWKGNMPMVGK